MVEIQRGTHTGKRQVSTNQQLELQIYKQTLVNSIYYLLTNGTSEADTHLALYIKIKAGTVQQ